MWEDYYQEYEATLRSGKDLRDGRRFPEYEASIRHRQQIVRDARKLLSRAYRDEDAWVATALREPRKKWFVAQVFRGNVPRRFFAAMIRAAVYESNPSANRYFVEPCVHSFGPRPVYDALLRYLREGADTEKSGANNALYWVRSPLTWLPGAPNVRWESATPESKATDLALEDIRAEIRDTQLREFVANEDVGVRRSLIPPLRLSTPTEYPAELRPLALKAIEIARNHPDEYIRHRLDIQLDTNHSSAMFKPLPYQWEPLDTEV